VLLSSKAAAALKTNLLDQESELQTTYKYLVNGFSFALLQYEFPNDTHAAALAIFGKDFREFLVRAQGRPFDALS
jgi:hypothetical protein